MERDARRGRGQWRGCYAFTDVTCDGGGVNCPKRTGGLKMGSTYYYYYELDDGTEHHDPTIPFTTSCPYLPGQPVNSVYIPIERKPLRCRSASMSSMANGDVMTMNPADKFMTPRPSPRPPVTQLRLNTSPSLPTMKRSARSISPKSDKSSWSPRAFFGLRSPPMTSVYDNSKRGRSSSASKIGERSNSFQNGFILPRSEDAQRSKTSLHMREASPPSLGRPQSREPSPLRQQLPRDSNNLNISTLLIPDEIAEEAEDDDNFASPFNRTSVDERSLPTQLSPPPPSCGRPSALRTRPATSTSKPLPEIPDEKLMPLPLRLRAVMSAAELPRSHFSISTISTATSSPTNSHFDFTEMRSISELNYDEGGLVADLGSGDEFTSSPASDEADGREFTGYSLPEDGFPVTKETPQNEALRSPASRTTFGGPAAFPMHAGPDIAQVSAFEELLSEAGYLGNMIAGK
ncbi:uncharacterized protein BP5553_03628 [Venustampulla echinocandica]|uniref:Uncharacterized protein n=1 Tax=Venustampulla echinocandica TaxID=2656787 RepID=A0A370TUY2_9HELO|nr:uncharacterized protein BP5553_03628 [Venustampulla echinocandica]RDL39288.1 hypothetical protein BP5553_03628 [Venustampulla echinocandica]